MLLIYALISLCNAHFDFDVLLSKKKNYMYIKCQTRWRHYSVLSYSSNETIQMTSGKLSLLHWQYIDFFTDITLLNLFTIWVIIVLQTQFFHERWNTMCTVYRLFFFWIKFNFMYCAYSNIPNDFKFFYNKGNDEEDIISSLHLTQNFQ